MEELLTVNSLAALASLSILEIVLGIDNIVFLAILTGKLPAEQQPRTRIIGLLLAAGGRIVLLLAISWVVTLDETVLFELPFDLTGGGHSDASSAPASPDALAETAHASHATTIITAKDVILILGGLFLLAKSTWEIGHQLEGPHDGGPKKTFASMGAVLAQIVAIDMVFSLDSVLTAIGMVRYQDYLHAWVPLAIMIAAVMLAIAVMIAFSGPISRFVNDHPSVKMLALAFLILIGVVLVAEGLHSHVPRGYIYFAMGFSLFVEMLNLKATRRAFVTLTLAAILHAKV